MRFLLALLSSFLLLNSQIYAISAGPEMGTSGSGTIAGTYAGVLIPKDSGAEAIPGSTDTDATFNALGLFTLNLPTSGLGTGTVSIFSDGRAFTGTIDAFGDPDSFEIAGVINASYNYSVVITNTTTDADGNTTTTETTSARASLLSGQLDAEVSDAASFTSSLARLTGSSTVQISNSVNRDGSFNVSSTVEFVIEGVQQTVGG